MSDPVDGVPEDHRERARSALAAAFELPALAWLAAMLAILATCNLRRTLTAALPAVLVVAAAAFSTNWIAHNTISPPYAHRAAAAQPLPAGVYADIYELQNAASRGHGPPVRLFGEVDVESIAAYSEPTLLAVYANASSRESAPEVRPWQLQPACDAALGPELR